MTADEFNAWLEHMGYNDSEATFRLGIGSRNTVAKYRAEGAPDYIGLACSALADGCSTWPTDRRRWFDATRDALDACTVVNLYGTPITLAQLRRFTWPAAENDDFMAIDFNPNTSVKKVLGDADIVARTTGRPVRVLWENGRTDWLDGWGPRPAN